MGIEESINEHLKEENQILRRVITGFADVLTEAGLSDTDELRDALREWKHLRTEAAIPAGTPILLIGTVLDEYDNQPYIDLRTAMYDPSWMEKLIGTRVFTVDQREEAGKALESERLRLALKERRLDREYEIRDGRVVLKESAS